jgi:alanine racemase
MRGVLEIDLNLLLENIGKIKQMLPANMRYIAAIKTNAYGLGLEKIASFLGNKQHTLVDAFAVLSVQEALAIRSLDTDLPIFILSPIIGEELDDLYRAQAIPIISTTDELDMLQCFAQEKQFIQKIHIKIDTGMGRLGVWFEEVEKFFSYIEQCDHLKIDGLATHFSSIASDKVFTQLQLSRFQKIVQQYAQKDCYIHACSSFGIDQFIEGTNAVRIGALHYGLPEDNAIVKDLNLQSVVRLSSFIAMIKHVPAGTKIGYEQTYCLERDTKIAIISLGYADGIPVSLSNCGKVLIHGQRCKIIGRVSMDQTMVDVTDLENVAVCDEVVFFGKQENEEIQFCEFAQSAQLLMRAAYMCTFSEKRITRKYLPEIFSDYSPPIGKGRSCSYQSFISRF